MSLTLIIYFLFMLICWCKISIWFFEDNSQYMPMKCPLIAGSFFTIWATREAPVKGLLLFSCSVLGPTLPPHELQHTRILSPSPSPRVCSDSCSLNWWCISKHLICCPLLLLPSIRDFSNESAVRIRWPKIGVSASASALPMNIQGWFPFGLTGLISLLSQTLSRVFANTTVWKHQLFSTQPSLWEETLTSVHDYEKTIALTIQTFVG